MRAYRLTTIDELQLEGREEAIPANTTVIISEELYENNTGVIEEAGAAIETVDAGDGIQVNLKRVTPNATVQITSDTDAAIFLEENLGRRGFSVQNRSNATLYLSFDSDPDTILTTAFIDLSPGAFFVMDQQLIPGCAIYGAWSSANGYAQVTEYV